MRYLLLALVLLAGCNGLEVRLDPKFAPLTHLREVSDDMPLLGDGFVVTVYDTAYTKSIRDLLARNPVGSVEWDALFLHEQQHSIREYQDPLFFFKYATSPSFRWEEEKIGWAAGLRHLVKNGRQVDVKACARSLATGYKGMVSEEDAEAWVRSVVGN